MLNKKTRLLHAFFSLVLLSSLSYGKGTLVPENVNITAGLNKETQDFFGQQWTEAAKQGIPVKGSLNITSEDMKALFSAGNIHLTHEFAIKPETITMATTRGVPALISLGCFGASFHQLTVGQKDLTSPNVWVPAIVTAGIIALYSWKNDPVNQKVEQSSTTTNVTSKVQTPNITQEQSLLAQTAKTNNPEIALVANEVKKESDLKALTQACANKP